MTEVYVRAGAVNGNGTREAPYNNFKDAVEALPAKGTPATLYIDGTFTEQLVIKDKGGCMMGNLRIQPWVEAGQVAHVEILGPAASAIGESAQWPVDVGELSSDTGLVLDGCDFVEIDGLEVVPDPRFRIRGFPKLGIYTAHTSHLTIRNVEVSWIGGTSMLFAAKPLLGSQNTELEIDNCRIDQTNLGQWVEGEPGDTKSIAPGNEAITIQNYDGFKVTNCHVSNSGKEGIDFKYQSRNGEVARNLVEYCRSASIYANEAFSTVIYHNIVRYGGYYTVVAGGEPQSVVKIDEFEFSCEWQWPDAPAGGITVSAGDLSCICEMGLVGGVWVVANDVYWMRGVSIGVFNHWRRSCVETQETACPKAMPLPCDPTNPAEHGIVADVHIVNNTCYEGLLNYMTVTNHPSFGIITLDVSMRRGYSGMKCQVRNNIVVGNLGAVAGLLIENAANPGYSWQREVDIDENLYYDTSKASSPNYTSPMEAFGNQSISGCDPKFMRAPRPPIGCAQMCPIWVPCPLAEADFELCLDSPALGQGYPVIPLGPGYQAPPDMGAHDSDVVAVSGDWVPTVGPQGRGASTARG